MYREEILIDGILHWRDTPNGKWQKCSAEMLTTLLLEARGQLANLRNTQDDRWKNVADPL